MRVDFAENFGERLRVLEGFMLAQDPDSAFARIEHLHEEVLRFADLVKLHPKIGRPAGVLAASSVEGEWRLERVLRLAIDAGLPELREYVLHTHLVLYAHSDSRVLMLSIRTSGSWDTLRNQARQMPRSEDPVSIHGMRPSAYVF